MFQWLHRRSISDSTEPDPGTPLFLFHRIRNLHMMLSIGTHRITAEDESRVCVQCDMAAVGVDWRNRSLYRSQSFQVEQGCQNSAKSHHA
jgi:hypothetical protein